MRSEAIKEKNEAKKWMKRDKEVIKERMER